MAAIWGHLAYVLVVLRLLAESGFGRHMPIGRNEFYTDGRRVVEVMLDHMDSEFNPLCMVYAKSPKLRTIMTKPTHVTESVMDRMIVECNHHNYTENLAVHIRNRRSIIPMYPGTKWCGDGNISKDYDDLGENRETDLCCRAHDHCLDYILPFSRGFGLFNWSVFTRCSCACDNQFYDCLKNSTDAAADNIGYLFFNVLGTECFQSEFSEKCIRKILFVCVEHGLNTFQPKVMRFFEGRKY